MKMSSLKPGMTVYDVGRHKMGNTTISTVAIWPVHIVSVDIENFVVKASWNGNPANKFYSRSIAKWREKKPILISGPLGNARLSTREEKAKTVEK
jgi:hypothetical protein